MTDEQDFSERDCSALLAERPEGDGHRHQRRPAGHRGRLCADGAVKLAPSEQISFPDCSFDLVFLGHVLHEADDPLTALQEARRVTRQRVAFSNGHTAKSRTARPWGIVCNPQPWPISRPGPAFITWKLSSLST